MIDFTKLGEYKILEVDSDGYIYFLFYKDVLVYIGKTISLASRIDAHNQSKIFDKVLFEKCAVENLRKRERELIKHYNPILNGEYQCKPKTKFLIVDNILFCHSNKTSLIISDNEVLEYVVDEKKYDKKIIFGYLKEELLCYYDGYDGYRIYNFSTNKEESFTIGAVKFERKDFDKYVYFDKDEFKYKPRGYEKLPNDYIFQFGKYIEKSVSEVRDINPGYISWFEENIPVVQWYRKKKSIAQRGRELNGVVKEPAVEYGKQGD